MSSLPVQRGFKQNLRNRVRAYAGTHLRLFRIAQRIMGLAGRFSALFKAPDREPEMLNHAARMFATRTSDTQLSSLVFANGKAVAKFNDNTSYHVLPQTPSLSVALLAGHSHEPECTRLVDRIVKESWTVVDVGANYGWFAVKFSKRAGRSGRVLAFEPIERTYAELTDNLLLNECNNVTTLKKALGDRSGNVTFCIPEGVCGNMGGAGEKGSGGRQEVVEMARLDDLAELQDLHQVDFIKADIEGGEFGLLHGAEKILDRFHPDLLLEMQLSHTAQFGYAPEEIVHFLGKKGYTGFAVVENGEPVKIDFVDDVPMLDLAYNFYFTVNPGRLGSNNAPR
jgi:FkbM family methyltransferase